MNPFSGFRRWWRQRKRRNASSHDRDVPLREFVYLDEVSVFSLIASRLGALETEFTDSESKSLRAEASSTVGVAVPVAKSEISSTFDSTQTTGAQVLRKATVQSTFRRLLEIERGSLALRPPGQGPPPKLQDVGDLLSAFNAGQLDDWMLSSDQLKRGQLVEVEVELEAETAFRVTAIIAAMFEFVDGAPDLVAALAQNSGIQQAAIIYRLLDKLLVGLVPLRGRSVHFRAVDVAGSTYLIHHELLAGIEDPSGLVERDLNVVGVAESGLFWKDLRRVVFARSRYLVMCRVARDGVHPSWTPVKLLDVLAGIAPTVVDDWNTLMRTLDNTMNAAGAVTEPDTSSGSASQERIRSALIEYCLRLAKTSGKSCEQSDLTEAGIPDQVVPQDVTSVPERRRAFADTTKRLAQHLGIEIEDAVAMQLRDEVLTEAGLDARTLLGAAPARPQSDPGSSEPQSYLDCEIVAIYW